MLVGIAKENCSQPGHPLPAVDSTEGKGKERKCISYLRKRGCKRLAETHSLVFGKINIKCWEGRGHGQDGGVVWEKESGHYVGPIIGLHHPPQRTLKSTFPQCGQRRGRNLTLHEDSLSLPLLKSPTAGLCCSFTPPLSLRVEKPDLWLSHLWF